MGREMEAGQVSLSSRAAARVVTLAVLTTYSDLEAKTVDRVFYFSDRFRQYAYGGGPVREFLPILVSRRGPEVSEMSHIQDFGASTVRTCELVLSNRPTEFEGESFANVLRSTNLVGARLAVAELFLPPGHSEVDLTTFDGTEHTVAFRGEAKGAVRTNGDTLTLFFTTVDPNVPFIYATAPGTDPEDFGKALPVVYGDMRHVPCISGNVGSFTTLAETLDEGATTIELTDGARFNFPGILWIDGERITYTNRSDDTLTGVVRGTGGTKDVEHGAGAPVTEIQDSKFYAAGHPVTAIGKVYAKKPNGQFVRITSGLTKNVNEAAGPDGENVATIRLTAAEVELLLSENQKQGQVTQQPGAVVGDGAVESIRLVAVGPTFFGGEINESNWGPLTNPMSGIFTDFAEPDIADVFNAVSAVHRIKIQIGDGVEADQPFYQVAPGPSTVTYTAKISLGDTSAQNTIDADTFGNGATVGPFTADFDTSRLAPGTLVDRVFLRIVRTAGPVSGERPINLIPGATPGWVRLVEGLRESDEDIDIEVGTTPETETRINTGTIGESLAKLRLYADVQGFYGTEGGYSVGIGPLLESVPDILRHFIGEYCNQGMEAIDDATFEQAGENLFGTKHALEVSSLGTIFGEIVSRIGWEGRCNVSRDETAAASVFRLHAADSLYSFGSGSVEIDQYGELEETSRDPSTIRTRMSALFGWDPILGPSTDERAYTGAIRASKIGSEVTIPSVIELSNAERRFGRKDEPPFLFATIRDTPTAQDRLGFLANESIRDSRIWGISRVPWTKAYPLQQGDMVTVPGLPWSPNESWHARVLGIARDPDTGLASLVVFATEPGGGQAHLLAHATISARASVQEIISAAAQLSAHAGLTAAASDQILLAAAALTGTAVISSAFANQFGEIDAHAAITGAATLIGDARIFGLVLGDAASTANATVAGAARVDYAVAAAMAAAAAVTASAVTQYAVASAMNGNATLTASPYLEIAVAAALSASAAISRAAVTDNEIPAQAVLQAAGAIVSAAMVAYSGAAELDGTATVTAAALVQEYVAAALAAAASVTAAARTDYPSAAALSANAALTSAALTQYAIAAARTATATMSADASLVGFIFTEQDVSLSLANGGSELIANSTPVDVGITNAWTVLVWWLSLNASNAQTIMAIQPASGNINKIDIRKRGDLTDDPLEVRIYDSGGTLRKEYRWTRSVEVGPWHCFAFTWDGTSLVAVIDGVVVSPSSTPTNGSGSQTNTNRNVHFNGSDDAAGLYHSAAIWDAALSTAALIDVQNEGRSANLRSSFGSYASEADLQHWWRFGLAADGGTPDWVRDEVSSGQIDLSGGATNMSNADIVDDAPIEDSPWALDFAGDGSGAGAEALYNDTAVASGLGDSIVCMVEAISDRDTNDEVLVSLRSGAGNVNRFEIRKRGDLTGDPVQLLVYSSAGTLLKDYRYNGALPTGVKKQLLMVWDESADTLVLYSNGSAVTADATPTDGNGSRTNSTSRWAIGGLPASPIVVNAFDGKIRSVAVWNVGSDASEVTADWAADLYAHPSGNLQWPNGDYSAEEGAASILIHWWRCGEPTRDQNSAGSDYVVDDARDPGDRVNLSTDAMNLSSADIVAW